ncbi:MAG: glycoside hydrolase family 16 protein [Prevotella sp.]|nr:glycoside hydrolase family 16 protein [Prevotella sp.]
MMNIKKRIFTLSCIVMLGTGILLAVHLFSTQSEKKEKLEVLLTKYKKERSYSLMWKEDFKKVSLNPNIWQKIKRKATAWACHMSDDTSLYQLKNGYLRLYCKRNTNKNDTARVITGGITTEHKQGITYGKVEVKARLKGAMGCWPAIWLVNNGYGLNDPRWAEIDIIERYNHDQKVVMTAHNYYGTMLKKESEQERNVTINVKPEDWNIYAVEVLPNCLIFSVNNVPVKIYERKENIVGQFPYEDKKYLRIDMQWGNPWLKDLREHELPAFMDIDWVKFYRIKKI